jgi:two-component system cell cycle sensor histidine kinase/response regulator CckA
MKKFKHLKIRNKLIAIILFIILSTLSIGLAAIILTNRKTLQDSFIKEADTAALVVGNGMAGALSFGKKGEGNSELAGFMVSTPSIKNVWIYDENNELFASYHRDNYKIDAPEVITPPITRFKENYLYISRSIVYKNDSLGTIYLRFSAETLAKLTKKLIITMVLIVVLLLPLSLLLALKLQGIISKPILDLVKVTKKVSSEGNYSLRVQKTYNDEVGMLVDSFNDMMEQVNQRDILRDQVEKELKAAEFFLSSVMESMPSMVITIDREGIITHWNRSAARLTGIEAAESRGKKLLELLPVFSRYKKIINEFPQPARTRQIYKEPVKINGTTHYLNITLFPLLDDQLPKLVLMMDNVTDIEIKEQQLRQSQKMETVGTLAGGLAHDFNNVLGGIIGTISLYKYKLSKKHKITQKEIEKYYNTIEESANRASDMVQHLLSLTRKQEFSFIPTDLNFIIKNTVKICKNTFDKSIDINARYVKETALAYADPTQLEQSLLNLCINASHAMTIMRQEGEKYGGSLNICLEKVETDQEFLKLHPGTEKGEDYWVISVQDAGIGMNAQTLAKIFDPFFTTKGKNNGTGLGLAMVYNIIKEHKGSIDVYSQEGIGTTFNIYLPALKQKVQTKINRQSESILRGEGVILVVDDEEIMRQTAKSILEECGYQVILAEDGEEAVKIYRKKHPQIKVVLLDMVMPKMSGKQAYLEMTKIKKDVKVLLASGFRKDSRVDSILGLGVKSFIQKPYALGKLANSIHQVINS